MPVYVYKAKRGPEKLEEGEVAAASQDQAVIHLEEMGLSPISVVEKEEGRKKWEEGRGRRAEERKTESSIVSHPSSVMVRVKDIDAFTWQLASLVKASVPMLRAMALISQQTESKSLRVVVDDLHAQIKDGKTLSDGLRRYPHLFNNLYLNMVRSGERGGTLHEVLYRVAEHREKEQAVARKIQAALAYPAVMVVVGIGTVVIMLTVFMPKFIGIFENMKQALPLPTKVLINLSNFMAGNWHTIFIAVAFILVVFGRARPSSRKKFFLDLVKLHIPFMKKFVRNAEIAKFARTLGMLLKNGLPVYESLDLATDTLDNEALRRQLKKAGNEIVRQGATLSSSLAGVHVFPSFAVNMIAVGEESGKLEESLNGVAGAYEKEVEQAMSLMTSLLEPVLILVIGGVVGFIVLAMLLPIFDIGVMAR